MSSPPIQILQDRAQLDSWIAHNPTVPLNVTNTTLTEPNFSGLDLNQADFRHATLEKPNFANTTLRNAPFTDATIRGGCWDGASIHDVLLQSTTLNGVVLARVKSIRLGRFELSQFTSCSLRGLDLSGARFDSARLTDTDLADARLPNATLTGVALTNCDLRGANLNGAELTNTTWYGCQIDARTSFRGTIWRPQHDAANDGVDALDLPQYRRALNWEVLRILGRVPLFSGAYLLLTVALSVSSAISLLNDWLDSSGFLGTDAPIPFPDRLSILLLGSATLALGATLFEFACPSRVKEFSKTRWVEELRRPGMLYVSETLQRPLANGIALVFTCVGAGLLSWLFLDRLASALVVISAAT
mgnify:CR=1 FL=1